MKRSAAIIRSTVALLLLPLLAAAFFAPAGVTRAAPEPGSTAGGGLLDLALLTVLNTLGDDAFALVDLSTAMPPNSTQHYGPYTSGSPDSGTCGNNWATDTYDRHFTVRDNGDGTFTVVQQFKDGSFVTMSGPSPGACDFTDGSSPGTIRTGVNGSMQGYFIISNVGSQTSTSPFCDAVAMTNANCTTTKFINTHFTPCYPATCTVTTYFDHYSAGDQLLIYHEWKNASPDRGGNHGDIADALVP